MPEFIPIRPDPGHAAQQTAWNVQAVERRLIEVTNQLEDSVEHLKSNANHLAEIAASMSAGTRLNRRMLIATWMAVGLAAATLVATLVFSLA